MHRRSRRWWHSCANSNARGDLIMKIGFIGLGHMGSGMAHNLLKAGHELTVYNRTPGKAQALYSQGARAATAVADACPGDVIITMLSNDDPVEGGTFGDANW